MSKPAATALFVVSALLTAVMWVGLIAEYIGKPLQPSTPWVPVVGSAASGGVALKMGPFATKAACEKALEYRLPQVRDGHGWRSVGGLSYGCAHAHVD